MHHGASLSGTPAFSSPRHRPAVLVLHHWGWWNALGDGVDRGLFYSQPEGQLTAFSHVRLGWVCCCGAASACHSPFGRTSALQATSWGIVWSLRLIPVQQPADAVLSPNTWLLHSTTICPRCRSAPPLTI